VDPYSLYMDVDPDPAFLRSLGLKMAHFEEEKRQIVFFFIFVLFLLFLNNQKLYKCSLHEKQETVKK
jgi:hypothetical protein